MRFVPLRYYKRCPRRTIIIVDDGARADNPYTWRFGPDTINRWPGGDYYEHGLYREPACQDYREFLRGGYCEYQPYEPDMIVDVGL